MKNKNLAGLTAGIFTLFLAGAASADMIGGVEFPHGSLSFADQVAGYTPGPYAISPYNNPAEAIGAPDYDGSTGYVSLGWGGSLVLKFTDNSLTTSGNSDKDLWVFEIGAAVEPTDVYISKNGSDWISVGYVGGATAGVDVDAYIGSGVIAWDQYSYVKLVDKNYQLSGSPFAGADIDAVGAISSAPPVPDPVPVPGAVILFGAGLTGLIGARRKKKA